MSSIVAQTANELLAASRALVGVAARSIAPIEDEVSLVQYRALVVLWEEEPRTLAALAKELDVHPSTATRLCDRLVSKGLVTRETAAASRREVDLRLSPAGRLLIDGVIDRRRGDLETIVRHLTPAKRVAVLQALESFNRAAASLGSSERPGLWP